MSAPHDTSPAHRLIPLRQAQLGEGFQVVRALPTREQRMVGAWCFLDRLGPMPLAAGSGMHVGAHPHTCLQTFTWMMEGEVLHRDSLGTEQVIRPGQVNLMTAGRGIAHTEDSLPHSQALHAAQLWIALPPALADTPPRFEHHADLPEWREGRAGQLALTLLAGRHNGHTAPTQVHSPLLGLDILAHGTDTGTLPLQPTFEYGVLPLHGQVAVNGQALTPDQFLYLPPGDSEIQLHMGAGARCLLLGGEPFAQPIHMWWNFVGHSRAYIEQAQAHWESGDGRFGPVPGSTQRLAAPPIPWPHTPPPQG